MAWIESHQSLRNHRKVLVAAQMLKMDKHKFIGHLHCLWWWALDNADIDGNLPDGTTPAIIASSAEVSKKLTDKFVEVLIFARFIEHFPGENPGKPKKNTLYRLHDWYDYAGKLMERRKANRERQDRFRNAHVTRDITVTSQLRNVATVPNRTVPNRTNKKSIEKKVTKNISANFEKLGSKNLDADKQLIETVERVVENQPRENEASKSQRRAKKSDIMVNFEKFWTAYPKKMSKGQAEKAFDKLNPDEQLLATMLAMIERAKTSEAWTKEDGQFIPYPATWLNAKGWQDEIKESQRGTYQGNRKTSNAFTADRIGRSIGTPLV